MSADHSDSSAGQSPDRWGRTLRVALAMRGGVSLAVWIGGAVAELDLFRRACNEQRATGNDTHRSQGFHRTTAPPDRATMYRELLAATGRFDWVEIDILSGASAGGLNAVLFGFAQAYGTIFDEIVRRTWIFDGGIWELLRDPGFGRVDSILKGDDRLFRVARDALGQIAGESDTWYEIDHGSDPEESARSVRTRPVYQLANLSNVAAKWPVERVSVELAATLLDDPRKPERPNRARFSFTKSWGSLESGFSTIPAPGDESPAPPVPPLSIAPEAGPVSGALATAIGRWRRYVGRRHASESPSKLPPPPEELVSTETAQRSAAWGRRMALDRMALAARATSSYPGAFEPAAIYARSSGRALPGRTAPMSPDYVEARRTGVNMARVFLYSRSEAARRGPFEVVDGGVFDNIPIDRAIRAIQRAPAAEPTGRTLVYLDPEPPQAVDPVVDPAVKVGALAWIPVIRSSLPLKQRTETEGDELALVRHHNDAVREVDGKLEALASYCGNYPWRDGGMLDAAPEFASTIRPTCSAESLEMRRESGGCSVIPRPRCVIRPGRQWITRRCHRRSSSRSVGSCIPPTTAMTSPPRSSPSTSTR